MESQSVQCPRCGKSASGQFCQHCGASLTGQPNRSWNTQAVIPWVALGLASFSLVFSLMSWFDRGGGAESTAPPMMRMSDPSASAPSMSGRPPDLSTMTPREAADRLFNRVMTASEKGDSEEAKRFIPMALQAYERIGTLDNDARYHMAWLHLTAGDMKGARAQADQIRKVVSNHLLGLMLEHELAVRSGNTEKAAGVQKAFLKAYTSEITKGRQEYEDHRGTIDRFRAEAQAVQSGKK